MNAESQYTTQPLPDPMGQGGHATDTTTTLTHTAKAGNPTIVFVMAAGN